MAPVTALDISKMIMQRIAEKTKIFTPEEALAMALEAGDLTEFNFEAFDALIGCPSFSDRDIMKLLATKSKSAKGWFTVFDLKSKKFIKASSRKPTVDVNLLIRLFVMYGNNIKKISESLDPVAKSWFLESIRIYGIGQQGRGNRRCLTLDRLAQAFPHITTNYFKLGIAQSFGDFPDDYPAILKSTVLHLIDPDGTLRPLAIVNNRKFAKAIKSNAPRGSFDGLVDKAYKNKSDFHTTEDKIGMCKYFGLMDADGNWFDWVLDWVNKISKEHGIRGRGVKRGRDESNDDGTEDGDDAHVTKRS